MQSQWFLASLWLPSTLPTTAKCKSDEGSLWQISGTTESGYIPLSISVPHMSMGTMNSNWELNKIWKNKLSWIPIKKIYSHSNSFHNSGYFPGIKECLPWCHQAPCLASSLNVSWDFMTWALRDFWGSLNEACINS